MTYRLVRAIATIVILASASAAACSTSGQHGSLRTERSAETSTLDSFLIVHVVCSDVLLEIPASMLGRSILVYTEFAALSTGGSEYAPGSAIDSRVVRWLRFGNKVALMTVNVRQLGRRLLRPPTGCRSGFAAYRGRGVRCGEGGRRRRARHRYHLAVHDQPAHRLRARVQAALSHGTTWMAGVRWSVASGHFRRTSRSASIRPGFPTRRICSSRPRTKTRRRPRSGSPSGPIFCCCRRSRCWPAARTSAWAISRFRSTTTAPASTAWSAKPSSRAIGWRRRIPTRRCPSR